MMLGNIDALFPLLSTVYGSGTGVHLSEPGTSGKATLSIALASQKFCKGVKDTG